MKSKSFVHTALVLGLFIIGVDAAFGQAPTTLRLTSKVRDFRESPDGVQPPRIPNTHPDFNVYTGCAQTGNVDVAILTNGAIDSVNFPNDNRNPRMINPRAGCFTTIPNFNDWYNDRDTEINRPFLYDLIFRRNNAGMYEYNNSSFFPLDRDSLTRIDPVTGKPVTRPIVGGPTATFGHLNSGAQAAHNFGFTMEFHANFTYIAADASHPAQLFTFTGDDDVWVFINGKLAIDIGGVHGAITKSITLDATQEAALGLTNGQSYFLDFFIAERHIVESNCRITTSLVLETQKVARPVANPAGRSFDSQVSVLLTTPTPGATIYYTVDGSTPDSTSLKYDPTVPVAILSTTTLNAIAYRAGWQKSDVMTETYTKNFIQSTLEILDQNGNQLTGSYLTELNTAYTIRVTTTQAGLSSVSTDAATKVGLDAETIVLTNPIAQGSNFVFSGLSPFRITSATAANGTTEASTYDTLTVRWVNPADPTRDIAEKKVPVRPAPKQARIYFSTKDDGSDDTNTYLGTETTLYVFVIDEVLPAGQAPKVILETTPRNGLPRDKDMESFDLVPVAGSPGKYRAVIPVDISPTGLPANNRLQLALEDAVVANYTDPMDGDKATANAGYGIAPDITAELQFTDKLGVVVINGNYYSPASDSLYLVYKDDWVNGSIGFKTVSLTITNNDGKAPGDSETFTVKLDSAMRAGSIGVWRGSIKLIDGPSIKSLNNTAETYVLGKAHAVVSSHDKAGDSLGAATDDLLVAYDNKIAVIEVEGKPGTLPNRADSTIKVTITDQNFSSVRDTIYTTLSCSESHDVVQTVMLIETTEISGVYVSTLITKTEGPASNDGALQCNSRDNIKVSYQDPVYRDVKEIQVLIDNPVTTRVYYSTKADGGDEINSVNDDADEFYAVVLARSADVAKVDSIMITFITAQNDSESFWAKESAPYSEKFIVKVPFRFVTAGSVTKDNQILEGKITASETNNRVTAVGAVTVDGSRTAKPIDLVASFAPVAKAYIKDSNGDGKPDKVYIVFEKPLGHLPNTVTSVWNDTNFAGKVATGNKITFLNADSNIIVIDYKDAFEVGMTSPLPGHNPKATLPDDVLFKGQRPVIEDSVGPIIITATKKPSNANTAVANDPNFNLDTLVVVLSEPLKTADFKEMLKFSISCDDYAHAKTIVAVKDPTINPGNPNEYTVIVDKSSQGIPNAGNCVFLNADPGRYSDIPGNKPPEYGVELKGADGKTIIQVFRGFPPVAGLDPNDPAFQVAIQDSRDPDKQGYSTPGSQRPWEVVWIPPAGFDGDEDDWSYTPIKVGKVSDLPTGSRETATPVRLPRNLSAIQVVSTTAYIARITIYDLYGNFVNSSIQVFGAAGELGNRARRAPKGIGMVSYLVWDMKDSMGQKAGNGVYVWKVTFEFKGGKQEIQYTKTGLMRKKY
ncbi:MAG: fibro-slime domain-containing protein [Fibrobacteria bacterium]